MGKVRSDRLKIGLSDFSYLNIYCLRVIPVQNRKIKSKVRVFTTAYFLFLGAEIIKFYLPVTCTNTFLFRCPYNQKNNTYCQVPKANFLPITGITSLLFKVIAIGWEWALIGSWGGKSHQCKSS